MRKIYGIGETVFDIIFKEGAPQAGKAGGSMLNSMVSMGRAGLPVSFISEFGNDAVGNLIADFLRENGVDTTFINRYSDANTTLALAFLDNKNDATYTFYKNHHPRNSGVGYPSPGPGDILLCGSFYSIWPEIRQRFCELASGAKKSGTLVFYDPNFRKTHLDDLEKLKPLVIENMKMASVVRGSDEDFRNIFGTEDADSTYRVVRRYCNVLIYSASTMGVFVRTPGFSGTFPVREITPVSTIGAGDNFNAGMITEIFRKGTGSGEIEMLDEKAWADIISVAVDFASEVCLSYENYISRAFASRYLSASSDQI